MKKTKSDDTIICVHIQIEHVMFYTSGIAGRRLNNLAATLLSAPTFQEPFGNVFFERPDLSDPKCDEGWCSPKYRRTTI